MTNPTPAGTPGPIQPGEWVADPPASTVSFTARNFGLGSVTGQVPLVNASVTVGPGGQPVSVRAELDARGIDTGHRRRDRDLRGPRFPGTGRWPAISFQARDIQADGAGWTIDGTLRVKDRDIPVRLDVGAADIRRNDPAAPVNICATARLDRRSAGINALAFLIGRTVSLSLAIRLRPPATVPVTSGRPAPGTEAVTTGKIRTIYQAEERQAKLPANANRLPFQLTGLSITIPRQVGGTPVPDLRPSDGRARAGSTAAGKARRQATAVFGREQTFDPAPRLGYRAKGRPVAS
jgi:polyisoprenoid-binding protein YceI